MAEGVRAGKGERRGSAACLARPQPRAVPQCASAPAGLRIGRGCRPPVGRGRRRSGGAPVGAWLAGGAVEGARANPPRPPPAGGARRRAHHGDGRAHGDDVGLGRQNLPRLLAHPPHSILSHELADVQPVDVRLGRTASERSGGAGGVRKGGAGRGRTPRLELRERRVLQLLSVTHAVAGLTAARRVGAASTRGGGGVSGEREAAPGDRQTRSPGRALQHAHPQGTAAVSRTRLRGRRTLNRSESFAACGTTGHLLDRLEDHSPSRRCSLCALCSGAAVACEL